MVYWMRSCRPDFINDQIICLDRVIDEALQHILGVPVYKESRSIIHLPLSLGGLGIPIASATKEAAFVSSVGASWHLQPIETPRMGYTEAVFNLAAKGTEVPPLVTRSQNSPTVSPHSYTAKEFRQSEFMKSSNGKLLESLQMNVDAKLRVILEGRACKGSSYWLTTTPNRWSNSELDPSSFRALLKYSVGLPIMSEDQPCPDCGKMQDKFGHHALSCKVASGKIDRHNSIVLGLSALLKKASINHRVESMNPMNNTRQRPGDLYMPEFDPYGEAFFDVSVISICAESYYKKASKGQLEGSKIRYDEKMRKYPELQNRFKPLVIESTGGWHAYSFGYLRKMAEHIAARTNKMAKDALNELLTSASVRLQRHQGTMLVRRCLGM